METESCVANALKPSRNFHLFGKLPPELRWEIWRMAICTEKTPKLHYYSLFNHDNGGSSQSFLKTMKKTYPPPPKQPHPRKEDGSLGFMYHPRLWSQPSQYKWTKANRFLYYWNAGLWTACMESRSIMLRYHEIKKRRPLSVRRETVTASDHGQKVYINVQSRDIVCLRFLPEDMAACVFLSWRILLTHLPFIHLPFVSEINLAFEFEDSWVKDMECIRSSLGKLLPHPDFPLKSHDSWVGGLAGIRRSFRKLSQEASVRGLVLRAHLAWVQNQIPRRTRLWLIDRGGRLPAKYKIGGVDDERYTYFDRHVLNNYKPCNHHFFIDGKKRYVECYSWDRQEPYIGYRPDVPITEFMWKVRMFCRPPEHILHHTGFYAKDEETFFRVLRPLPGTDERSDRSGRPLWSVSYGS
ncbi:hypothetical protein HJFPF1_11041 [Paramyrothecium foliicola]|nr:hypothetical protein HJFPF1_11041 [Paramyrothecium foliicola]